MNTILLAVMEDFPDPDDFAKHVGARLFQPMVALAQSTIQHFQGDLYHAALQIHKTLLENHTLDKQVHWYLSFNESGFDLCTDIGESNREHQYAIVLRKESRSYGDAVVVDIKVIS